MIHLGEVVELVGLAIAVGVDASHDFASTGILSERTLFINADEDFAIDRRCNADRIRHLRRTGEQTDIETLGSFHVFNDAAPSLPRPHLRATEAGHRDTLRFPKCCPSRRRWSP